SPRASSRVSARDGGRGTSSSAQRDFARSSVVSADNCFAVGLCASQIKTYESETLLAAYSSFVVVLVIHEFSDGCIPSSGPGSAAKFSSKRVYSTRNFFGEPSKSCKASFKLPKR